MAEVKNTSEFFDWIALSGIVENPSRNIVFNKEIRVSPEDYKCDHLTLKGVEFKRGLRFDIFTNLRMGIKFVNCNGGNIIFDNCTTVEIDESKVRSTNNLFFFNCDFNRIEINSQSSLVNGVTIRNGSKVNDLLIQNSEIKKGGLTIINSNIEKSLHISSLCMKPENGILIQNSKVNNSRFHLIRESKIDINNSHFTKPSFITACDLKHLSFNQSTIEEDLEIQSCKIDKLISYDDTFQKRLILTVKHSSIDNKIGHLIEVSLTNTKSGQGFEFYGNNQSIKSIKIPFSQITSGSFLFDSFNEIYHLEMSGHNSEANLIFSNCVFRRIYFENLINRGSINFSTCSAQALASSFEVFGSSLGTTLFLDVNFKYFERVDILNSIMTKIEFSGGVLFEDKQLFNQDQRMIEDRTKHSHLPQQAFVDISHPESRSSKKKEIYRQLRTAADNQGDKILSSTYKALELKYFWNELKKNKHRLQIDRLSLFLSNTNDMGLNWGKPIWLLIGFSLVLYFPIIVSASPELRLSAVLNPDLMGSIKAYWNHVFFLPQLLNPARSLSDLLDPIHNRFWTYLWDGLHRIGLAFFIFQIISAFRKYIR